MIEVDGKKIAHGFVMVMEQFTYLPDGSLVKCEKGRVPQRFHVYVIDREAGNVIDEVCFSNNIYAEAFMHGMKKRGYAQIAERAGINPEEAEMRDYLFRGKLKRRINSQTPAGTWIYGGYYFWKNGACIHQKDAAIGLSVDPETVGQYTGIHDKNGVKIFEGDIVEFQRQIYKVLYHKISCAFEMRCIGSLPGRTSVNLPALHLIRSRIIGNIHDNPELLGRTEEE